MVKRKKYPKCNFISRSHDQLWTVFSGSKSSKYTGS